MALDSIRSQKDILVQLKAKTVFVKLVWFIKRKTVEMQTLLPWVSIFSRF
jgi:hypothetical protein